MPRDTGPGQDWFNPSSFSAVLTPTFGNTGTGLSWLTGPSLINMDMTLSRTFKLSERFNLQFRLEADNAFNTPHFSDPNTNCTISSTGQCAFGFGQISTAYGPRIVMLGANLTF
jgi:trimeric autotransporter adhesin